MNAIDISSPLIKDHYYDFQNLGNGAMASVYQAKRKKNYEIVAIKVIKKEKLRAKEIELHFRMEHRSIVKAFDVFSDTKDNVYMVLEFCANGDLDKYIKKRHKLEECETRTILTQIVDGLEYLQKHKVIHRDLKPSNILLDSEMNAKIADFGMATLMDGDAQCEDNFLHLPTSQHNNMTICGTPNYMAPEIISRKGHGAEVDMWSLGVILYTMLTGLKPPFDSESTPQTLENIVKVNFTLPKVLSWIARDLVCGLLEKEPTKRFTVQQIKAHQFFQLNVDTSVDSGHVSGHTSSFTSSRSSNGPSICAGSLNGCTFNKSDMITSRCANGFCSAMSLPNSYFVTPQPKASTELPPFSTKRLGPHRDKFRQNIISILSDGRVSIEILQQTAQSTVKHTVQISSDSDKIRIYNPENMVSSQAALPAPSCSSCKCFTRSNLPKRYWKIYQHAALFAYVVGSFHPKITWYTKAAKYRLMENDDMLVNFVDGSQIKKSKMGKRITFENGTSVTIQSNYSTIDTIPAEIIEKLSIVDTWHEELQETARILEMRPAPDNNSQYFPIIIGSKSDFTSSQAK